jgi:hypothetical protein
MAKKQKKITIKDCVIESTEEYFVIPTSGSDKDKIEYVILKHKTQNGTLIQLKNSDSKLWSEPNKLVVQVLDTGNGLIWSKLDKYDKGLIEEQDYLETYRKTIVYNFINVIEANPNYYKILHKKVVQEKIFESLKEVS